MSKNSIKFGKYTITYNPNALYSNWHSGLDNYYAQLYSKYGNTPYWSEFMANPYLTLAHAPHHINDSFWQDWARENYPAAMDYVSQLLQRINTTEYDSASEQVARDRAAGLNADLIGNVNAGESSSPFDPSLVQQPSIVERNMQKTAISESIVNQGISMVSSILGAIGTCSDIQGQNINNAIGSVAAIDQTSELFYKRLIDASPVPQFKSDMTDSERNDVFKQALSVGFNQMDWNGIDRKSKKFYRNGFQNWIEGKADSFGFEKRITKEYSDFLNDKQNIVEKAGSPLYKDNLDEMIGVYMDEIGNLAVEVQKVELQLRETTAELENLSAGINLEATQGAANDPNYVPNITSSMLSNPQSIDSANKATIAESGSRIETAKTTEVQQQIKREQKKAVQLVGRAFDKAIGRVEKSNKFRTFKPFVLGSLKVLKASTMSLTERWVDPRNPGATEATFKAAQQAALVGAGM